MSSGYSGARGARNWFIGDSQYALVELWAIVETSENRAGRTANFSGPAEVLEGASWLGAAFAARVAIVVSARRL